MSKESLAKFWKRAGSDPKLQQEFDGLFNRIGDRRAATGAAIVTLGARHGFKFTADELKEHLAAARRDVELSETEMEGVAGGFKWATLDVVDRVHGDEAGTLKGLKAGPDGRGIVVF